jgi:hypothetical protein
MKILEGEVVKKQDGSEWTYNMPVPESLDEMIEVYSEAEVYAFCLSTIRVRLQSLARSKFDSGQTREEVEQALAEYRPGTSVRKSLKGRASELVFAKAAEISNDDELRPKVQQAFFKGDWKEVIRLLAPDELPEEEEE